MADAVPFHCRVHDANGTRPLRVDAPRVACKLGTDGRLWVGPGPVPGEHVSLARGPQGYLVTHATPHARLGDAPLPRGRLLAPGDRVVLGAASLEVVDSPLAALSSTGANRVLPPGAGQRFGRYELRDELGRGQYGTVFAAWDPQLERDVAIKVLMQANERARQRFLREVRTTARLRHPHIVATHDCGEERGRPFLVMERVDGRTLAELSETPPLPEEVARWMVGVARAIAFAHGEGVVHRDLKPQNIIIDAKGHAYVLDFGVASLRDTTEAVTVDGAPVGTPAYMAPEQHMGARGDARGDVYGLGATLFHALTGSAPGLPLRDSLTPPSILRPGLPAALDAICQRALAHDPQERTPSATALADELEAWLRGEAPASARGRVLGIAVLALGLLVGGLGWALTREGDPPPPAPPEATPAAVSSALSPAPAEPDPRERLADVRARAREGAPVEALLPELERAEALAGNARELLFAIRRERVECLLRRARFAAALEAIERLGARLAGAEARALHLAEARALLGLGRREDALDLLEALSAVEEPDDLAHAAAALRRLELHDPLGARAAATAALALEPAQPQALLVAGLALARLGEGPQAIEILGRARQAAPDEPGVHLARAEALALIARGEDELTRALEACARAQELAAPGPLPAAFALEGELALALGEYPRARAALDRAIAATGGTVRMHLARGLARARSGEPEEALADWRRARELDPLLLRLRLRELRAATREQVRAALDLRAPTPLIPPRVDLSELPPQAGARIAARVEAVAPAAQADLREALGLAAAGQPWERLELPLRRALRAAPDSPALALEQVRLLGGRARFVEAAAAIARARELGADPHELSRWAAELALRRGARSEALAGYARLAAADPAGVEGLSARAEAAWCRGRADEAASLVARALELDPLHPPSCLVQGVAEVYRGRPREALDVLDATLAREGAGNVRLVMMRAVAHAEAVLAEERAGRHDPARRLAVLAEFDALRGMSRGASPRILGAKYALELGTAPRWAARVLDEARAAEPERAQVYWLLGQLAAVGREPRERVLRLWRRARRVQPEASPSRAMRAAFIRAFGEGDIDALLDPGS